MASTAFLCRRALAQRIVPVTLGLSSGIYLISRQKPMRLDALPARTSPSSIHEPPEVRERLNPDMIKQLSSGSLAGFLSGLVVAVFSKTLVFLIGLAIVSVQIASRYGIDLVHTLKLKERAKSSKILSALSENTPFKTSFGVTFALASFMQF